MHAYPGRVTGLVLCEREHPAGLSMGQSRYAATTDAGREGIHLDAATTTGVLSFPCAAVTDGKCPQKKNTYVTRCMCEKNLKQN